MSALERAVEFERSYSDRLVEEVVPAQHGRGLFTPSLPLVRYLNSFSVNVGARPPFEELVAEADELHAAAGLPHRKVAIDDAREFAEIVARALASSHRGLVTTEWSKAKRRGVLIDSNQNGEGKTIATVYSVRPTEGAPVSTPLRWDEVSEQLDPSAFTMEVVLERVRQHGDLYEGVLTTKQSLGAALKRVR